MSIDTMDTASVVSPDSTETEPEERQGDAALARGDWERALRHYSKALLSDPLNLNAKHGQGVAYLRMGSPNEALAAFTAALAMAPKHAGIINNIGACWMALGQPDAAKKQFESAIALDPGLGDAWFNLGRSHERLRQLDSAITAYRQCLARFPQHQRALAQLIYAAQWACDWTTEALFGPRLDRATRNAIGCQDVPAESPFKNIVRCMEPRLNLAVARAWSERLLPPATLPDPPRGESAIRFPKGRIVIGYLSSDFHNHATAHLIQGLFRLHDRERFQIHAYSHGPDDDSPYRRVIQDGCDRFTEFSRINDRAAADLIREDRVGILVELKGHTQNHRLGICGYRPAPINVSFLGFPGSYGASWMDYIIADAHVIPPGMDSEADEAVVRLPNSYQVNDHRQPIDPAPVRRADCNLPENGLVWCAFHQPYKIEPSLFSVWMTLLAEHPDSVLWLLDDSPTSKINLRGAAVQAGVDPDRLVFAPRWAKARHLARHRLADVMLDTRRYNGHTTTSDALWAGVPVVAVSGFHFASRVSRSLLTAVGLGRWCADTLSEYKRLASFLAVHDGERNRIRRYLNDYRQQFPLFDTPRFTRDLERAFTDMWRRWQNGIMPGPLDYSAASFAPDAALTAEMRNVDVELP